MKHILIGVMAFAVCVLLVQCRKPVFPDFGGGEQQTIIFTTGDDGSKGDFFQEGTSGDDAYKILKYRWAENDVVRVYASVNGTFTDGEYCGVLKLKPSCIGETVGVFEGWVVMPSGMTSTSKVRFYHFGSDVRWEDHAASVDFGNQNGELTGNNSVSSKIIGMSSANYRSDGKYSGDDCKLKVQFAIAKVNLESFGTPVVVSTVVNTGVNVNEKGEVSYTSGTSMLLDYKGGDYYVVFVPDSPASKDEKVYSFENAMKIARVKMNVKAGGFYSLEGNGGAVVLVATSKIDGLLPGKFSVSATKQVQFAKGNLWWGKKTDETVAAFHFEDNQYDCCKTWNTNHVSHLYWVNDIYIAQSYQMSSSLTAGSTTDVLFTNTTKDTPNKKFEVDGQKGIFRALSGTGFASTGEMDYLIARKKTIGGKEVSLYGNGKIKDGTNEYKGIFLLPDDWTGEKWTKFVYGNLTNNNVTLSEWKELESAGVVFLPLYGDRTGGTIENTDVGKYWLSCPNSSDKANAFQFTFSSTSAYVTDVTGRKFARFIRLVVDVKPDGVGVANSFDSGVW
ncbi:MAG: hypothetical protein Q4F69_11150 [Bacteroidia bacterium]|nr:hypothetical protein [Bacteroidia bacterium]